MIHFVMSKFHFLLRPFNVQWNFLFEDSITSTQWNCLFLKFLLHLNNETFFEDSFTMILNNGTCCRCARETKTQRKLDSNPLRAHKYPRMTCHWKTRSWEFLLNQAKRLAGWSKTRNIVHSLQVNHRSLRRPEKTRIWYCQRTKYKIKIWTGHQQKPSRSQIQRCQLQCQWSKLCKRRNKHNFWT